MRLTEVLKCEKKLMHEKDCEFMANILSEIAEYAVKNGMKPNETIRTIAENMIFMLEVATFDNWGKDDDRT